MQPTLGKGALVVARRGAKPERGDIILFELPDETPQLRRVMGLPGETLSVNDIEVTIPGIAPTYQEIRRFKVAGREFRVVKETIGIKSWEVCDDTRRKRTLPPREAGDGYFVLADNREHARDSGMKGYGPVKEAQIRGVVVHVLSRGEIP